MEVMETQKIHTVAIFGVQKFFNFMLDVKYSNSIAQLCLITVTPIVMLLKVISKVNF